MHAPSFHEPRLQPLPKTFFDETASDSGLKRRHSFGGYIPYSLVEVTDEDSCSKEDTPFQREVTCEEVMFPAYSPDATSRTLHHERVPRKRITCSLDMTPRSVEKVLIGRGGCRVKDSENKDVPFLISDGPVDLRSPLSSPCRNTLLQPRSPLRSSLDASTHLCATSAESYTEEPDAEPLSTYPSTPPGVFSFPLVLSVPAPPPQSPISCNAPPTFLLDSCQPICRRSMDRSTCNALASNAPERWPVCRNDPAPSTFSLATLASPSPESRASCRQGARPPKQQANYLSSAPCHPIGDLMVETFAKTWASRQQSKEGSWASREGSEEGPCPLSQPSQQEVEAEAATCNSATALVDSIQQEVDPFPDNSKAVLGDDEPMTTLMIRNLPRNITPLCLIRELNQCGCEGTYNFVYLPQSFNTKENLGFAFVNFIDSSMVSILISQWHLQRPFQMTMPQAPLNISPAKLQGLAANLQKWATPRLRRVKNRDLRPFILDARTKLLRSVTDAECMAGFKNQSSHAMSPGHV